MIESRPHDPSSPSAGFRLKAPEENGGILAVPAISQFSALLRSNQEQFRHASISLLDRPLTDLRQRARREALDEAVRFHDRIGLPIPAVPSSACLVTGHQPELFHPGVWIKNFATHSLAKANHLTPLNVVLDGDIVKATSIRVPVVDANGVRIHRVPFAPPPPEGIPCEEFEIEDKEQFHRFPTEVQQKLNEWKQESIVGKLWRTLQSSDSIWNLGDRLSLGRRLREEQWGCHNWEVPLSQLCGTEAFAVFACHILANLPRFHEIHNECLREYRRRHRIRSRNHPVPDLHAEGDWIEAPFWVWQTREKSRHRLMVRCEGQRILPTVRGEPFADLSFLSSRSTQSAVADWRELEGRRIKIRPRAITTTLFFRLLLADAFVHGIGGAIYDEFTNELIRRFYGLEPPGFMVISGTLRLPMRPESADETIAVSTIRRQLRDLDFNPDRHIDEKTLVGSPVSDLRREKSFWISRPIDTRIARRNQFLAIRELNQKMQPFVASERQKLQRQIERLSEIDQRLQIIQGREYAYCLHSEKDLQEFFRPFL